MLDLKQQLSAITSLLCFLSKLDVITCNVCWLCKYWGRYKCISNEYLSRGFELTNLTLIIYSIYTFHIILCRTYHVTIVCPRTKLHETLLLIKGKELNINFTRGLVNSRRIPHHFSIVMQNCFCHYSNFVIAISTADEK